MSDSLPVIKLCGLRSLDDALAAHEAGADYVGFVLVETATRYIPVDEVATIAAELRAHAAAEGRNAPRVVGVTMETGLDHLRWLYESAGLDVLQLAGGCDSGLLDALGHVPAIPVVHVGNGADPLEATRELAPRSEGVILDTYVEGEGGGSGRSFDWSAAAPVTAAFPNVLVAGGLTPGNVARALSESGAAGADVSSGIESAGAKDPLLMRAFVAAAMRDRATPTSSDQPKAPA